MYSHVGFLLMFCKGFCGLLFPPEHLKRSRSPGRRWRRHEEAACNIKEREEKVEKRGKRLRSQSPWKKRGQVEEGGSVRGRGTGGKVWEGMGRRGGVGEGPWQEAGWRRGYVQEKTHQQGVWISVQQQDDECQPKKYHSIITNQLKTAKKEKRVVGVCVLVRICLSKVAVVSVVSFVSASFVAILTWRSRLSSKVAQDMGVEVS